MGTQDIEKRVAPLLDLVGLSEKRDRYPTQAFRVAKNSASASRALWRPNQSCCSPMRRHQRWIQKPRAQFLPFSGEINKELGLTVLLITHEMEVVKVIADHVAVIDGGRIVEQRPDIRCVHRACAPNDQGPTRLASIACVCRRFLTSRMSQLPEPGSPDHSSRHIQGRKCHGTDVGAAWKRSWHRGQNIMAGAVDEIAGRAFGMLVVSLTFQ